MTDEDKKRIEAADKRYMAAAHGMQSGVAMELNLDPKISTAKDLRVGINSAHVTNLGLARLLMAKGVFTLVEYHEAMADAMEEERTNYEARLQEKLGGNTKITLA